MVHLDRPVTAEVGEQVSGAGLVRGQAGDAGDRNGSGQFPVRAVAVALDEEYLLHVGEQGFDALGGRQGLDGARLDPAVCTVHGPRLAGY
jgi:hypothetical protein